MPVYKTKCSECSASDDVRMTFSEYDLVRTGQSGIACGVCGSPVELAFAPGNIGFGFKEGESGGWPTKSLKENTYRAARSSVMSRRERDHVFKPRLVPNYQGQEAASWKEVRDHVQSAKGSESASTYDPLVKSEK